MDTIIYVKWSWFRGGLLWSEIHSTWRKTINLFIELCGLRISIWISLIWISSSLSNLSESFKSLRFVSNLSLNHFKFFGSLWIFLIHFKKFSWSLWTFLVISESFWIFPNLFKSLRISLWISLIRIALSLSNLSQPFKTSKISMSLSEGSF